MIKHARWVLRGGAALIVGLFLCINPVGFWPFIPLVIVGVWVEVNNLIVGYQMRRELRQVLNGQRTEA